MKKYNIQEVVDIINGEGIEYAIMDYMSGDSIEDKQLALLWDNASKSMNDAVESIKNYIENQMDEDFEWE